MNGLKLTVKETGKKSAKFLYTVIDSEGNEVFTRSSNRTYVACSKDGLNFFGRVNLVPKDLTGVIYLAN